MKTAVGVSHSKVIISGEHSAVYGYPALVASVNRNVRVTIAETKPNSDIDPLIKQALSVFRSMYSLPAEKLQVTIESSIPVQSGMGSSAAVTHALFIALGRYFEISLTDDDLIVLVNKTETFAHGNPSGIDTVAVVKGGLLKFQRDQGRLDYSQINSRSFSNTNFLLIQSGKPEETTKEMIRLVADKKESQAEIADTLSRIGVLTNTIIEQLTTSGLDYQHLTANQRLLEDLGVVGEKAEGIVKEIEHLGGAAKITGAGGVKDGSGMILAYHDQLEIVEEYAAKRGLQAYTVRLGRK